MTLEHDDGAEQEHAAFADWDAAYVLGALAPVERSAFEDHLSGCERCRAAVAELAPLPGLLARAPRSAPEDGAPHDEPLTGGGPRADLVDLVVRRDRRHRLLRSFATVGVAAALVVGTALTVPLVTRGPSPAETVTLSREVDTPLAATVAFTPVAWGTRLSMECTYAVAADAAISPYGPTESGSRVYTLVVVDVEGTTSQVSTWAARPGAVVRLDAATAVPLDEIASVEIRSAAGRSVLVGDRV